MVARMLFIAAGAALVVASPAGAAGAARCKDAKGRFVKCPEAKPAAAARCRLNGKFVKCGTPGAKPA